MIEPHSLANDVMCAFGLGAVRSIDVLGGTATRKWSVVTVNGRYLVRIRPPEFARPERIHFDHTVLIRLAAAGLPVPSPLATSSGENVLQRDGETIEVMPWMEGEPWSPDTAGGAYGVGQFLARFHSALSGDLPSGKEDQLREDHPDALQPCLGALFAQTADLAIQRQLETINDLLEQGRRELETDLYPSLPHAVIHGDFHPGNLGFRGAEVVALYDFDYLAGEARARDLVDALIFFGSKRSGPLEPDDIRSLTQPFFPDLSTSRGIIAGYQSICPLTRREWQALPLLLRSRWIQMRLRGSRKIPSNERIDYVLHEFFTMIDWLRNSGRDFFARLQSG